MEEFEVGEIHGRYYPGDRGTFVLLHGLASSSGEFFNYPEKISSRGYGVIIFDFRGHGKSGGIRGYESMDKNIEDIRTVLGHFEGRINKPIILLGHSLGAATVVYALAEGIGDIGIAIAPPASIRGELNAGERILLPIIYAFGRLYEMVTGKRFYIKYRAAYDTIFIRDETVKKAREMGFLSDRLWIGSYKPLMAINAEKKAREVRKPCLVIIPTEDKLVNPEGQRRVYEAIRGYKELYLAEGYNHSVMGEDSGEVLDAIISFVERRRKTLNPTSQ